MGRSHIGCLILLFFLTLGGAALYWEILFSGPPLYRYHLLVSVKNPGGSAIYEHFVAATDMDAAIIEAKRKYCPNTPCDITDDKSTPKRVR
jgi:hypothetical protein